MLGLVPVGVAQQSIWAGPHRERGLRLTPGCRVGAETDSKRGGLSQLCGLGVIGEYRAL